MLDQPNFLYFPQTFTMKATTQEKFKSFKTSINFIILQGQFFGLGVYNLAENSCKRKITANIFKFTVFALIFLYCLYVFIIIMNTPIVQRSIGILNNIFIMMYLLTIAIANFTKPKLLKQFLFKIFEFDQKISSLGTMPNYSENRKKITKRYLVRFFYITICFFSVFFVDVRIFGQLNIYAQLLSVLLHILNCCMFSQFYEAVFMIKIRFGQLNQQIFKIINNFKKDSFTQINVKREFLVLSRICTLHHHLIKLIQILNNIFGKILLMGFGFLFFILTVSLFFVSAEIQMTEVRWKTIFCILIHDLPYIFDSFLVCQICHLTIQEVINKFFSNSFKQLTVFL